MIRNFKALGMALVAVLAMSALVASAAQAKSTILATTSTSPLSVHATGENIGEEFTLDGVTTVCKVSHYTGTVTNNASTMTVTPSYTECELKGVGIKVEVTNHDCIYIFTGTSKTAPGAYDANVSIECVSKGITITSATCAATITTQGFLTTVGVKNGSGDLQITPNVTGITGTVTADGFLCPFNGTGVKNGGKYVSSGAITLTGTGGTIQISGE